VPFVASAQVWDEPAATLAQVWFKAATATGTLDES
jgi:hypothetical protein